MFDKLQTVVNRYEQIGEELTHPEVVSNNELFRKLMKEHSELTPIVEKYREYTAAKNTEKETLELLSEAGLDKELKELAEEMTPGGLNWQATNYLMDNDAFKHWQIALDAIMERVTGVKKQK